MDDCQKQKGVIIRLLFPCLSVFDISFNLVSMSFNIYRRHPACHLFSEIIDVHHQSGSEQHSYTRKEINGTKCVVYHMC